ncbi:lipase secretion chaperone [Steroidobacter flavus]|uniref:Lipase chaperone n=1 Tax=Steroidobacter flavus TaxID=1842136 RepID=A0ABV8SYW0_9GAMM
MRHRVLAIVCLLVAVGAAIFWWRRPEVQPPAEPQTSATLAEGSTTKAVAEEAPDTNIVAPDAAPPSDSTPGKTDAKQPFRVDSTGKLVVDEQTRLNMEALFAQTDRADLPEAQQNATATLPPAAATEATALLERYDNYSKAQRQSYPPGIAPATEEAALAELDGLHALRVAHFGPDVAKALYGVEEDTTRSLIDLMRLEKDQSLTLPEKAERAQQLHDGITARQQRRP